MKKLQYIFVLLAVMALASCSDDTPQSANQNADLKWCVRAAWHDGLASGGNTTRAFTATNLFAPGGSDIDIAFADYPDEIDVECKKNDEHFSYITLTKGGKECDIDRKYWQYTPSIIYKVMKVKRDDLKFYATFILDDGDELITAHSDDPLVAPNPFGYSDIRDTHMRLTFRHTKALLRFAFKVDEDYDKIRNILVTGITLTNVADPEHPIGVKIAKKVLNKDNLTCIAYAYVDPTVITTATNFAIQCTYSIYDKDTTFPTGELTDAQVEAQAPHLTRDGVQARNTFTLSRIVFTSSDPEDRKIKPGYYYDLNVTLNPDYLYVLSEHDNKHMTIQ